MINRIIILLFTVSLFFGCATMPVDWDRRETTTFVPIEANEEKQRFLFSAGTGIPYPANNPTAEKVRHKWIEKWMELNNVCPDGYEVLSRKAVKFDDHPEAIKLHYELQCK